MNDITKAFAALGIAMIAVGVGLLGYLGYVVFLIIDAPEKVGFVKFLLEHIGSGDALIHGYAGNESFELNLTEPARTVVLMLFGVVMFWIVAGIAKAIISAGLGVVRAFGTTPPRSN